MEFEPELRKWTETLQQLDDIDTINEIITGMIQQSTTRETKAT